MNGEFYTPRLTVDVGPHDHSCGRREASVILVEYGDYECPHCGEAHHVLKGLHQAFGEDLCLVFRHFPLRVSHPHAEEAAEAAEAANANGAFWKMHDLLFENQDRLEEIYLLQYGALAGLTPRDLKRDLEARVHYPRVQRDVISGMRSGVNGTPTFFINGLRHNGDYQFATMMEAIKGVAHSS